MQILIYIYIYGRLVGTSQMPSRTMSFILNGIEARVDYLQRLPGNCRLLFSVINSASPNVDILREFQIYTLL